MTTILITFGASAVSIVDATAGLKLPNNFCARLRFEPLASNAHRAYVGTSAVTNDASGTGVIRELAAGSATATVTLDAYEVHSAAGLCQEDAGQWYVHGYSGENIKVTAWQPF